MIDVRPIAARIAEEHRLRYADWDEAAFVGIASTATTTLAAQLGSEPDAERVLEGHLTLVAQAVQLGHVDPSAPTDLFTRLLLDVVPRRLAAYPRQERLRLLARVWNLGEGLGGLPAWVRSVAGTLLTDADDLEHLDVALAGALEPLLGETRAATWGGPFDVAVIDLAQLDFEFVPGAIHAAAPAVVCVHDRFRPDTRAAVALSCDPPSRALGLTPCLGTAFAGRAGSAGTAVRFEDERAIIHGRDVALPTVHEVAAHAVLDAGFVAVAVADSQRLWVVGSAS